MFRKVSLILSLFFALLVTGGALAQRSSVQVQRVRIVPIQLANGDHRQIVMIDWKNVGKRPIIQINANVLPYSRYSREPLKSMVFDYTIFATQPGSAIEPGQTYRETEGNGFLLPPEFGSADRVDVTVVGVKTL